MKTIRYSEIDNTTLRAYANRGCPLFQVTKQVDGCAAPIEELTAVDFCGRVGRRIEGGGWTGPGYVVVACEPVVVL